VNSADGTLTSVAVHIAGSNDSPTITSNGGGATASINVAENTTAVSTVAATDVDLPAQTLSYSIAGGADAAKFSIVSGTGVLSFISAPNFEAPTDSGTNNVYDVIVRASDGTLFDDQAIGVTVTGVNDNSPVITSNGGGATASINVAENTTAVTTVAATDADLPVQTLGYSIVGGADAAKFSIVSGTGVLSFISAPNFEAPTDSGANNVYDV
ncbi:cadherin repeat domain-containing protein, partial [Pseudomonas fluorescens]|uniref:cadherin repeat domain-containing protein n=1 Tax=Pseudomonas fluorescens TaxID=294 RepID=UPI00163A79B2